MRKTILLGVLLGIVLIHAGEANSLDFYKFMIDRSTLWCPGGLIAVEDHVRDVVKNCGEPVEVIPKQNTGPIWVYHFGDDKFVYYVQVLNDRVQRIASTPCSQQRYDCFDLR